MHVIQLEDNPGFKHSAVLELRVGFVQDALGTNTDTVKDMDHKPSPRDPKPDMEERAVVKQKTKWDHKRTWRRNEHQNKESQADGVYKKLRRNLLKKIVPAASKLEKHAKKKMFGKDKCGNMESKQQKFHLEDHSCMHVDAVAVQGSKHINKRYLQGNTQLQLAVMYSCSGCAKKLIESGADINVSNNEGLTPLMCACQNNDAEMCKVLLNCGAKTDLINKAGETAVLIAAANGQYDQNTCLKLVLQYRPNVNLQDKSGLAPLHTVIFQSKENDIENIDVLCRLMQEGADMYSNFSYEDIYKGKLTDPFQLASLLGHIPAMIVLAEAGYTVPYNFTTDWTVDHIFCESWVGMLYLPSVQTYFRRKSDCPQSLESLCRNTIRKAVPGSKKIACLELPKVLVDYVNFVGLETQCLEILRELNDGFDSRETTG